MLVIASKEPFEGVIDVVKGIISPGALSAAVDSSIHRKRTWLIFMVLGTPYP